MSVDSKKVWAGVAAGLTAGLTAPQDKANIIYTPAAQMVNALNPQANIDFEQNGTAPLSINYDSTNGLTLQKQRNESFPEYVASSTGIAAAVPFGEVIDGSSTYSSALPAELNNGDGSTGQFVQMVPPQVQYIGVEFSPSADVLATDYGWIGFEVTDGSSLANLSGTVTGFAYDDSGVGIAAGAIPEPSSLMLLALGAVGLARYRRRSPTSAI
jgi:hypothetical protein